MSNIIDNLKQINLEKIRKFENKNQNSNEYKTQLIIMKILNSSDNCFLEIPIEVAFDILKCLINENEVEETYIKLVSYEEYKKRKDNKK